MGEINSLNEISSNSPLLVHKAWLEIEKGNYNNAISILSDLIKKFPFYPTPYLIYAIALAHIKDITLAKEMIYKCDSLLGEHSTADYYYELIEKINRDEKESKPVFEDTINEILNESFLDHKDFVDLEDIEIINESDNLNFTEDDHIKTDKVPIITETMAEIYFSQNKYSEALDIYNQLIELKPEHSNKFNQRILEIQNKIASSKL